MLQTLKQQAGPNAGATAATGQPNGQSQPQPQQQLQPQQQQQQPQSNRGSWLNFEKQRSKDWKQVTHEGRREMLTRYKFIMKEIDIACGNVFRKHKPDFQFMDVCSSPGGFSEYVLSCNRCHGVGLSLPIELGGHVVAIDTENYATPDRYHMHFYDVTTVAWTLRCENMYGDKPPEQCIRILKPGESGADCSNLMDLMILDGSFLGGKGFYSHTLHENDADNPAFNVYSGNLSADQALLVAQIIIMCHNLKEGGSVVLRLSMTWNDFRNGVLCLLRRMFSGTIENYKPRSCHQDKISYYLICKGFMPMVAQQLDIPQAMQTLLDRLRAGGSEARLVPLPALEEGASRQTLYAFWRTSFDLYYHSLYAFIELVRIVQHYNTVARQGQGGGLPGQRGAAAFVWVPCWHLMCHGRCKDRDSGRNCHMAHGNDELHPFVQEAFALSNGRMEWPAAAHFMFAQLQMEGNPQMRALQRLRRQQHEMQQRQQLQQQQQQQAAFMAMAMQQQQQQQHMSMMGGGDEGQGMFGGMSMGLMAGMNDARLSHMIMMQTMNQIRDSMHYGGSCIAPFVADTGVFGYGDSIMSDMQAAGMQAAVAAQNARVMQQHAAAAAAAAAASQAAQPTAAEAAAAPEAGKEGAAPEDAAAAGAGEDGSNDGNARSAFLSDPSIPVIGKRKTADDASPDAAKYMWGMRQATPAAKNGLGAAAAANTAPSAGLATGTGLDITVAAYQPLAFASDTADNDDRFDFEPDDAAAWMAVSPAVKQLRNGAGDVLGLDLGKGQAPQVSGYLQWLSLMKLVVADDGYTLQALLAYLGD